MEVTFIFNYGHYVVLAIFAALLASMFGAFIFFAMRGARIKPDVEEVQASRERPRSRLQMKAQHRSR